MQEGMNKVNGKGRQKERVDPLDLFCFRLAVFACTTASLPLVLTLEECKKVLAKHKLETRLSVEEKS